MDKAAKTWNADHTYFVTNGTSTANKIVVQSLTRPGDIVLIDRNCHKSHHYGLVLAGAYPLYLDAYPLAQFAIYGAVSLETVKKTLLELLYGQRKTLPGKRESTLSITLVASALPTISLSPLAHPRGFAYHPT